MRYVLLAGIVLIAITTLWLKPLSRQTPEYLLDSLSSSLDDLFYTKEVRFDPELKEENSTLRDLLPLHSSTAWWLMNGSTISAILTQDARVQAANVGRCWGKLWGCFEIKITLREPAFVAELDGTSWIIGKDGGFLKPASAADLNVLPLVSGLGSDLQGVKSWLDYLNRVLPIVQSESGLTVRSIKLMKNGELLLSFREGNFTARFDYVVDDWARLKNEASRLRLLVAEMKGNISTVREFDLAYDRLAVAKIGPQQE